MSCVAAVANGTSSAVAVTGVWIDGGHSVHMDSRGVVVEDKADVCQDMADKGHAQRRPSSAVDLSQGPLGPYSLPGEAYHRIQALDCRLDARIYSDHPRCICCLFWSKNGI